MDNLKEIIKKRSQFNNDFFSPDLKNADTTVSLALSTTYQKPQVSIISTMNTVGFILSLWLVISLCAKGSARKESVGMDKGAINASKQTVDINKPKQ